MIKITAEYDSWNPASKITDGLISTSTKAEASTEFILLTGLFISIPACKKENMSVALRTDGVKPVTKANDHNMNNVTITLIIFNLPPRKKSILKTK
jgi:hypothetical protein